MYEQWSEETKTRSCCPLCERKFSSKAGANELSGKLLDMSLSMPDDIQKLEKQVAEAEEKERSLANAVVYVDQCKCWVSWLNLTFQSDVSLMDSLFTSAQTLGNELNELRRRCKPSVHKQPLSELKKELSEKEESIASVSTELDEMQVTVAERNKLTTELHAFKERRIALGELTAQSAHLNET
ncbi:unnamed protein product, partial [Cylicostephanus goldi]